MKQMGKFRMRALKKRIEKETRRVTANQGRAISNLESINEMLKLQLEKEQEQQKQLRREE